MRKILICFFILILYVNSAIALKLSMSPAILNLDGVVGENICKNVSIRLDREGQVSSSLTWIENYSNRKDYKKYTKNTSDMKLSVKYPKVIYLSNETLFEFCLKSDIEKNYSALLSYSVNDKNVGVAILIDAKIKKESTLNEEIIFPENKNKKISISKISFKIGAVLFVIFALLILKLLMGRK